MIATPRSSLAAAALFLGTCIAQATLPTCTETGLFTHSANATGSVAVPGFRVNSTYEESTWTFSRYIADSYDANTTTRTVFEIVGLKTSPLSNLSDPQTPYTGCVLLLDAIPPLVARNGANDTGTCSSLFGQECLDEITQAMNSTASSFSGKPASGNPCGQVLEAVTSNRTSACNSELFTSVFAQPFLSNSFTPPPPSNSSCQNVNPGDSDATHAAFPSWSRGLTPSAPDDYSVYDQAAQYPTPLLISVWLKETDNSSATGIVASTGWADTRVMCLPANVTAPGSRNETAVIEAAASSAAASAASATPTGKKGAAGRVTGMGMGLFGVSGLTVLAGLAL